MKLYLCRWSKAADGSHRLFRDGNNAQLKLDCVKIIAEMDDAQTAKHNIGSTSKSAEADAAHGCWKKNRKTGPRNKTPQEPDQENPFKDAYDWHVERTSKNQDFKSQLLAQQNRQLNVMQNISNNIGLISYDTDDYWSLFLEYLRFEFEPKDEKTAIRLKAKQHKDEAIVFWRGVVRQPSRYTKTLKDERIKELYDEWCHDDERERDRSSNHNNHRYGYMPPPE